VKETWLYGLEVSKIKSLASFNEALSTFIREYNLTVHSAIGKTPMDRFLETRGKIADPPSREWLDEAFMNRVMRKVKSDATLSIKGTYYDAPMRFMGQTVEVRYLPLDEDGAYIYFEKVKYPLRKTDKALNSKVKREGPMIDYGKANGGEKDV
jgi:hypothetical protein